MTAFRGEFRPLAAAVPASRQRDVEIDADRATVPPPARPAPPNMKHSLRSFAFSALPLLSMTTLAILAASVASGACTTTRYEDVPAPAATSTGTPDGGDAAPAVKTTSRVEGKSDTLFDAKTDSYAMVEDDTGVVVAVGVDIPLAAFTSAPASAPFQDDLVLEMPQVAKEQTILNHVRVNWLSGGHSPDPYDSPHFDMHFHRGTLAQVDDIDCKADTRLPGATLLPTGYGKPELCVNMMGQHSWPQADKGTTWKGSIIMGYFATKVAFIEPMIPKSTMTAKQTFELEIAKPETAAGATTLYPRRMTAKYDETTSSYAFEFDKFETID